MNFKNDYIKDLELFKVDGLILRSALKKETVLEVAGFYKDAPFPNYEGIESIDDLESKVIKNDFLRNLKKYIGSNKKFIEVGSGTCQLSLALAYGTNNRYVAFDPTIESLNLGVNFAEKNNVSNVEFVQADIFDSPIKDNSFDFVWCSGVLHHTEDAHRGFKIIRNWAKKDGLIVIGLYNKYGRFWTVIRQWLYKITGSSWVSRSLVNKLDPYLRNKLSESKRLAWIRDQYEHPVETLHTIDEVLRWFDESNVEFLGAIPDAIAEDGNLDIASFDGNRGSFASRLASQIDMLFSPLGQEGGLFIVIGRAQ